MRGRDGDMDQSRMLRRLREEALLTIAELSDASGVSEDTISKIENGHRKGRSITLRRLTRALGVDPEALLSGGDARYPPARDAGPAGSHLGFVGKEGRSRDFAERLTEAYAAMERLAQVAREERGGGRTDPVAALEYAEGRRRSLDSVVREVAVFDKIQNKEERRRAAAVAWAAGVLFEDLTIRLRR